jgi:hypothetical protein
MTWWMNGLRNRWSQRPHPLKKQNWKSDLSLSGMFKPRRGACPSTC